VKTARVKRRVGDLRVVRLELLHAQNIGTLPSEPPKKTLARRAAQAVRIEGDDAQSPPAEKNKAL
jgi:hypothetical protein